MGQTALHDRPARRVHRDRMRSLAKPDGLSNRIDIVAGQQPDFATGSAMQQGEDADQGFMRMHQQVGGPPLEQPALLLESERPATKSLGLFPVQALRRIDKDQTERGQGIRKASTSPCSTVAQSCFPRSLFKNEAKSRTAVSAASMVESLRGSVPARRARALAVSMNSANPAIAGRSGSGAASIRRCRRPAASRSFWSVGIASPCSVKKSCIDLASGPMERPERRALSSRDCG